MGTVQESFKDIKNEIKEISTEVNSLEKKYTDYQNISKDVVGTTKLEKSKSLDLTTEIDIIGDKVENLKNYLQKNCNNLQKILNKEILSITNQKSSDNVTSDVDVIYENLRNINGNLSEKITVLETEYSNYKNILKYNEKPDLELEKVYTQKSNANKKFKLTLSNARKLETISPLLGNAKLKSQKCSKELDEEVEKLSRTASSTKNSSDAQKLNIQIQEKILLKQMHDEIIKDMPSLANEIALKSQKFQEDLKRAQRTYKIELRKILADSVEETVLKKDIKEVTDEYLEIQKLLKIIIAPSQIKDEKTQNKMIEKIEQLQAKCIILLKKVERYTKTVLLYTKNLNDQNKLKITELDNKFIKFCNEIDGFVNAICEVANNYTSTDFLSKGKNTNYGTGMQILEKLATKFAPDAVQAFKNGALDGSTTLARNLVTTLGRITVNAISSCTIGITIL